MSGMMFFDSRGRPVAEPSPDTSRRPVKDRLTGTYGDIYPTHHTLRRGIELFVAPCGKMAGCLLPICSPASGHFLNRDRETRICGS